MNHRILMVLAVVTVGFLAPARPPLAWLSVMGCAALQAQGEPPEASLVRSANERTIKLEGQLHVQLNTSSVDSVVTSDVELRRMRITALGDAGNGFSGALQTDFGTDRVRIRDAFIEYAPSDVFALRAGQFKIPFNGIEMTSSKRLLTVERGNRIRGHRPPQTSDFLDAQRLSARQRGFMAIFRALEERLTLYGGAWQGNGENAENNDGKEFAARAEYRLLPRGDAKGAPLVLGLAAVTNGYFGSPRDTLRVVEGDTLILEDAEYAAAFEGWLEYGKYLSPGLHVAGNVIAGDNPTVLVIEGEGLEFRSFMGLQGWAEYLVRTGSELLDAVGLVLRADRFDPDTDADDDANYLVTPGLNVYHSTVFKAQANYDVSIPQSDELDTESAFRFQIQLLF